MKMCGNCSKTDHKYVDCPFINMQFPLTKKEYTELQEKSKKWDELQSRHAHIDFGEWLQDTKLRELVEKKMEWASPYKTSQLMNGYLYRELRQLLGDSKK